MSLYEVILAEADGTPQRVCYTTPGGIVSWIQFASFDKKREGVSESEILGLIVRRLHGTDFQEKAKSRVLEAIAFLDMDRRLK